MYNIYQNQKTFDVTPILDAMGVQLTSRYMNKHPQPNEIAAYLL